MAIVLPVANNPHGGSWARRAKALIASAQTAMGQTADLVEEAPVEDTEPSSAAADGAEP